MVKTRHDTKGYERMPEKELLLFCARTTAEPESVLRIETLLRNGIDWEKLLFLASRHRVLPLLYRSLCMVSPDFIPLEINTFLRDHAQEIAFRNIYLSRKLAQLLKFFDNNDIPALSFKGPLLAATGYESLSLRQFSDLDFLVHRRDFYRAKQLLLANGYKPTREHLTEEQEDNFLQSQLIDDETGVVVEIQYGFAPKHFRFHLNPDQLWDRLEEVSLVGEKIDSFSSEDTLLILCVHGAKHGWERLAWICDIAEMARSHPNLDWQKLLDLGSSTKSQRMLFLGLYLAHELLDAPLPEYVVGRIHSDPKIKPLATVVYDILFEDQSEGANPIRLSQFHVQVMETVSDRFWYRYHITRRMMALNEKDRAFLSIPAPFSFLYYLIRPVRLTWEYGYRLQSRTPKEQEAVESSVI